MKANYEELEDMSKYSTTETKVGTWNDGKPIYRKIFGLGAITKSTNFNAPISNLDKMVKIEGIAYISSFSQYVSLPFSHPSTSQNYDISLAYVVSSQEISVSIGSNIPSISNVYATMEYTKTTD